MNTIRALVGAALVLLLATGCGGNSGEPSGSGKATPTPTSTPSPTAPALAKVSASTACQILFPEKQDSPLLAPLNLMSTDSPTPRMLKRAVDALDTIKRVERVAPPALAAQLQTQITTLDPYLAQLKESGSANLETTELRASGLEVTKICQRAIALG